MSGSRPRGKPSWSPTGIVVAELRAPSTGPAEAAPDSLLADAIRKGLIRPAALPPGPPPATTPVSRLEDILAPLVDARRDR